MALVGKAKLSSRAKMVLGSILKFQGPSNLKADFLEYRDAMEEILVAYAYPTRKRLLVDLANLQGEAAIQWFWGRWGGKLRPESPKEVIELRNDLRKIWRNYHLLYSEGYSEDILNKWFRWLPSPAHLTAYASLNWAKRDATQAGDYLPFRCSISSSKLVPDICSLRAMLIQGVFEHWQHFRYCTNKNCATPFFIAKRTDQTVCDAEICKAEKQRQHALKWWRENRAKKSGKAVVTKTTKKGSKGNVTRKAR